MSENKIIIPFVGLNAGEHKFSYNITDSFFQELDYSEVKQGELSLEVLLTKQTNMLIVVLNLKGHVQVICDRCADKFNLPLETSRRLIFKTGGDSLVEEEEIVYLPLSEHEVDLTHHVYESIMLSLPIQKVHPLDEAGESTCNNEALEALKKISVNEKEEDSEGTDPRWDQLKNLKIN